MDIGSTSPLAASAAQQIRPSPPVETPPSVEQQQNRQQIVQDQQIENQRPETATAPASVEPLNSSERPLDDLIRQTEIRSATESAETTASETSPARLEQQQQTSERTAQAQLQAQFEQVGIPSSQSNIDVSA